MIPNRTDSLTFEEDDRLEMKAFCESLERYAVVEHDYVEGSLVLALNAGFGAGKSTFIQMWKNDLLSRRSRGDFVPMPVVLNSWESDHCGDPMLAILAGLIEVVENWKGDDSPSKEGLEEASKDIGWFLTGLGNGVAAKFTGIDPIKAAEFSSAKKAKRSSESPDLIKLYQQRVSALNNLRQKIKETFGGDEPKVIIFIDELDRCRPDYAIYYLETIKHVFNIRGLIFILAVDADQLRSSAGVLFGPSLDFNEYFRKFAHRTIHFEPVKESSYRAITGEYIRRFLAVEGKRSSMLSLDNHRRDQFVELAKALRMRPRQIQEAFRTIGHVFSTTNDERKGNVYWCLGAATVFLAMLSVAEPEFYQRVIKNKITHEEFGQYLISLLGRRDADWWYKIYLTGCSRNEEDLPCEQLLRSLGFLEETDPWDIRKLGDFLRGWGDYHRRDRFWEVAQRIETMRAFDSST